MLAFWYAETADVGTSRLPYWYNVPEKALEFTDGGVVALHVSLDNDAQFMKLSELNEVTVLGRITLLSFEQPLKAFEEIDCKASGSVMDDRLVQPEKQ